MAKVTTDGPITITAIGMVTRDIADTRARPAGTAASSTIGGRGRSGQLGGHIGNGEKAIARTLVEVIGAAGRDEMDGGRGAQNRRWVREQRMIEQCEAK
jgi:hypothetical protein